MFQKLCRQTAMVVIALSILLCPAAWGKVTPLAAAAGGQSGLSAEMRAPAYHATDAIQARGVLTIAVSMESKYNYLIPDAPETYGSLAGTRDGIVPELCRRIAKGLGVEAKFVEYATTAAQLQAAAAGEVDIAADNFVINAERLALYEMTDTFHIGTIEGDRVYLHVDSQSGTAVNSEADLAKAKIAVVKGTAQATYTAAQYPQAELAELADNQAVLDALAAGTVDAGVFTTLTNAFIEQITQAIGAGTVAQSRYEIAIPDTEGFGFVLMKGNEDLCRHINRVFSHLRQSGWLHQCYKTEELESVERGIISRSGMVYQNISVKPDDCPSLAFDDLDTGLWYHEYVDYAIEHGLMNGTGAYAFSPDGTLTRAQVITVLWRLEGSPKVDYDIHFRDVAAGQWFTEVIRWAVQENIMEGYGGGTFGPNDPIKWQELAAILFRYAAYKGYDVSAKGDPASFTDAAQISSWAYDAMQWAAGHALIADHGGGPIVPADSVKRSEFAAATKLFLENVVK